MGGDTSKNQFRINQVIAFSIDLYIRCVVQEARIISFAAMLI